jgi:signal transduction histidine kinase
VKRPAIVHDLQDRFGTFFGLRAQLQLRLGVVVAGFALAFVVLSVHIDERRQAEQRRAAAQTLAVTAAAWLDGDAHAGLGTDPTARIAALGQTLGRLLEASEFEGTVRTLRPVPESRTALMASPEAAHAEALETVLCRGAEPNDRLQSYRPEMAPVFVEGKTVSLVENGRVLAWAPVLDSWGATVATVSVETSAQAAPLRRLAFAAAAFAVAGLMAAAGMTLTGRFARRVSSSLELLIASAEDLGRGRTDSPIDIDVDAAPSEIEQLAEALEVLRVSIAKTGAGVDSEPGPPAPAPPMATAAPAPPPAATIGEVASEFDLALLAHQLMEPIRQRVRPRGVETQLICPDGVPTRLIGPVTTLHRTLDALLSSAARSVEAGRITLRMTGAGAEGDRVRLRFEVADTGPGIPFAAQEVLRVRLVEAATLDPGATEDLLQRAGALAARLGGELRFETQPGQGSRFGFAVTFQVVGPLPSTAFQPRPAMLAGGSYSG